MILQESLSTNRDVINQILDKYGLSNPRIIDRYNLNSECQGVEVNVVVDIDRSKTTLLEIVAAGLEVSELIGKTIVFRTEIEVRKHPVPNLLQEATPLWEM